MTLTLYITNSDNRKVTKDLQTITTINTIETNDVVNTMGIQCAISYDDSLLNVNYCYCHELNRYYYVTISFNNHRVIYISCAVDVLMSYRNDILSAVATCVRNEGVGDPTYIVDKSLPIVQGYYNITAQLFPLQPFDTDALVNTVLITQGG